MRHIQHIQDWQAMGLPLERGQNAFSACVPRSTNAFTAPKKRGPRPDGPLTPEQAKDARNETNREWMRAQRTAKLLAFRLGSSHNFAPVPSLAKSVKAASSRLASA